MKKKLICLLSAVVLCLGTASAFAASLHDYGRSDGNKLTVNSWDIAIDTSANESVTLDLVGAGAQADIDYAVTYNGTPTSIRPQISIGDPTIASVENETVSALSPGETEITLAYGGAEKSIPVTVSAEDSYALTTGAQDEVTVYGQISDGVHMSGEPIAVPGGTPPVVDETYGPYTAVYFWYAQNSSFRLDFAYTAEELMRLYQAGFTTMTFYVRTGNYDTGSVTGQCPQQRIRASWNTRAEVQQITQSDVWTQVRFDLSDFVLPSQNEAFGTLTPLEYHTQNDTMATFYFSTETAYVSGFWFYFTGITLTAELQVSEQTEEYAVPADFDYADFTVTSQLPDGTYEQVPMTADMLSDEDKAKLQTTGTHTLTVHYKNRTGTTVVRIGPYAEDVYVTNDGINTVGAAYSIAVKNAGDYAVTYSTDGEIYTEENPSFTSGSHTVYWKVTGDGADVASGQAQVTIEYYLRRFDNTTGVVTNGTSTTGTVYEDTTYGNVLSVDYAKDTWTATVGFIPELTKDELTSLQTAGFTKITFAAWCSEMTGDPWWGAMLPTLKPGFTADMSLALNSSGTWFSGELSLEDVIAEYDTWSDGTFFQLAEGNVGWGPFTARFAALKVE